MSCRCAAVSEPALGLEGCVGRGGRLLAPLALRRRLPVLRPLVAVLLLAPLLAEALVELEPRVAASTVLGELRHELGRDVGLDAAAFHLELGQFV